jgi:hypothetical protein
LCVALLIVGCGSAGDPGAQRAAGVPAATSVATSPTASATLASAPPTLATTPPATTAQTPSPSPARTPTPSTPAPAATANLCGAPANPWGYNFCGRGTTIALPPSNFCSFFNCIASFTGGRGYVTECRDGSFSKSGGISGSCSGHGGSGRTLYAG